MIPALPPTGARPPAAAPLVKICGLTSVADALLAREAGAHLLGGVTVPESPRATPADVAGEIARATGLPLALVTAETDADRLRQDAEASGAAILQLHGDQSPDLARELAADGRWEIWRALRVRGDESIPERFEPWRGAVQGLLLDAWHPDLRGGSGVAFDWEAAARTLGRLDPSIRLIAAGGLTPETVEEAVAVLRPHVVDVSSGVEASPGRKDPDKVRAFVARAIGT